MIKSIEVGELKVGDVVIGSGKKFTIVKLRAGMIRLHPYLTVKDSEGKTLEHDTSFQDTIEVEVSE